MRIPNHNSNLFYHICTKLKCFVNNRPMSITFRQCNQTWDPKRHQLTMFDDPLLLFALNIHLNLFEAAWFSKYVTVTHVFTTLIIGPKKKTGIFLLWERQKWKNVKVSPLKKCLALLKKYALRPCYMRQGAKKALIKMMKILVFKSTFL